MSIEDLVKWIELHPLATTIIGSLVVFLVTLPLTRTSSWAKKVISVQDVSVSDSTNSNLIFGDSNVVTQHFHKEGNPVKPLDYREHPSPTEIFDSIKGRPGYEHHAIYKTFQNIPVNWLLQFQGISRFEEGECMVGFRLPGPRLPRVVSCIVNDIEAHPRLKRAMDGDLICIQGVIDEVDLIAINLRDVTFVFPDGEKG